MSTERRPPVSININTVRAKDGERDRLQAHLDALLRNCGARTVVITGVSVNVAHVGLTLGLLNRGYQVVVPRDAVAGIPADYSETMLDNTYAIISTVVTTDEVLAAWA